MKKLQIIFYVPNQKQNLINFRNLKYFQKFTKREILVDQC